MMDKRKRGDRLRAALINAALMLSALAFVLVAAEAYLRYIRFEGADLKRNPALSSEWTDYDQLLGFVRKPNIRWRHKAYPDKFAPLVSYDTDESGFRNPPGVTKADIAFIGDSFTEGGSTPYDDTFPRLVERKLGVPVINLGHGSYGPPEELSVLWRFALKYSPRRVIWVLFESNDLTDSQKTFNGGWWALHLPASADWSTPGTMWFDDIQLHELEPAPNGGDWRYRSAIIRNMPEEMPEQHTVGENLARAGGFEEEASLGQWEISQKIGDRVARDNAANAPEGKYALKVSAPASLNLGIAQLYGKLKPVTPYLLTGYIRTENVLGPARLEVQQQEGTQYTLLRFTPGVSDTQEWTKLSLVFTTPDKPGDVRVFLRRMADPPKEEPWSWKQLKLAQLVDVAANQRARLRAYWGLVGTFASTEFGRIEVGFRYKYVNAIDQLSPQGWQVTEEMLRRGHEICREHRIQLLVVYLPSSLRVHGPYTDFPVDAPVADYVPDRKWDAPDEFALRTAALCEEMGVAYIDATPKLRDSASKHEVVYAPRYDTHLYYRGHAIVADLIAEHLQTATKIVN